MFYVSAIQAVTRAARQTSGATSFEDLQTTRLSEAATAQHIALRYNSQADTNHA